MTSYISKGKVPGKITSSQTNHFEADHRDNSRLSLALCELGSDGPKRSQADSLVTSRIRTLCELGGCGLGRSENAVDVAPDALDDLSLDPRVSNDTTTTTLNSISTSIDHHGRPWTFFPVWFLLNLSGRDVDF